MYNFIKLNDELDLANIEQKLKEKFIGKNYWVFNPEKYRKDKTIYNLKKDIEDTLKELLNDNSITIKYGTGASSKKLGGSYIEVYSNNKIIFLIKLTSKKIPFEETKNFKPIDRYGIREDLRVDNIEIINNSNLMNEKQKIINQEKIQKLNKEMNKLKENVLSIITNYDLSKEEIIKFIQDNV